MSILDYHARQTFRRNYAGGYTAVTKPDGPTNPVRVICAKAAALLEQHENLELPGGIERDVLSSFSFMSGYMNQEFTLNYRHAVEIAEIGKQLLEYSANGMLELNDDQVRVIEHLIETVGEK